MDGKCFINFFKVTKRWLSVVTNSHIIFNHREFTVFADIF